jgi:hypothetical protein
MQKGRNIHTEIQFSNKTAGWGYQIVCMLPSVCSCISIAHSNHHYSKFIRRNNKLSTIQ